MKRRLSAVRSGECHPDNYGDVNRFSTDYEQPSWPGRDQMVRRLEFVGGAILVAMGVVFLGLLIAAKPTVGLPVALVWLSYIAWSVR